MMILVDPIQATLCRVPEPSFETLNAVFTVICDRFKLESEAEMGRWEDDGGAPHEPETVWLAGGLTSRGRIVLRK